MDGMYNAPIPRGCTDIDECTRGTDNCDAIATCNNTNGGFQCECPDGYVLNINTCDDIDECSISNECAVFGSNCINNQGGYRCECTDGFYGNGYNCQADFFFAWGLEQGD
ncbi:epidermal growth factor-like protein 6, partial [Anneissia japonica]|uniref:epidermal growth factor-like protein 6 n=1 Tax=Anneissia japonica TaxID=1529436 RepID=UPI0014259C8C